MWKIARIKQWKFFFHDTHNGVNTYHESIQQDFKPLPTSGLDIFQGNCVVVHPGKVSHCLVLFFVCKYYSDTYQARIELEHATNESLWFQSQSEIELFCWLACYWLLLFREDFRFQQFFNEFYLSFRGAFTMPSRYVSQIALFVHLSNILIVGLSVWFLRVTFPISSRGSLKSAFISNRAEKLLQAFFAFSHFMCS